MSEGCRVQVAGSRLESSRRYRYRAAHREELNAKSRAYHIAHREEISARKKAYWASHLEEGRAHNKAYSIAHREEKRVYDAARYTAQREEKCAESRDYNAAHREERRAYNKAWQKANPEKIVASSARRRARKANARGASYATAEHIKARRAMWGDRCYICGEPAEATDHVIPLAKGGTGWPANLRPICKSCNTGKKDGSLESYLARGREDVN